MADIIYNKLQKDFAFSVHRIGLRNEKEALCGTVVYVRCGQVPEQRDDLDETILKALQSQYPKSLDNPKYFIKGYESEQDIEKLCGVDIHKTNISMRIDINTELLSDVSGWEDGYKSQMNIPVVAYDVQSSFTTEYVSFLSSLSLGDHGKLLTEIDNNLFIYQDFLH